MSANHSEWKLGVAASQSSTGTQWTGINNILLRGESPTPLYAQCSLNLLNALSYWLIVTGFGDLGVPQRATVVGIEARAVRHQVVGAGG
jgi:hypothetical protein